VAVRNELVKKRAVICRVTVLTVNECVPPRSRYPRMALTGVVCIAFRLDDVLTTQRPDLSYAKDAIKQNVLRT
jgi:hypothetical protein